MELFTIPSSNQEKIVTELRLGGYAATLETDSGLSQVLTDAPLNKVQEASDTANSVFRRQGELLPHHGAGIVTHA